MRIKFINVATSIKLIHAAQDVLNTCPNMWSGAAKGWKGFITAHKNAIDKHNTQSKAK